MGQSRYLAAAFSAALMLSAPHLSAAAHYTVVAWSETGISPVDADFSVFSVFPPRNTLYAQVIDPTGKLVRSSSVTVTYEPLADPDGSINSTSAGKTNFWQYLGSFLGLATYPTPDAGLTGPMNFDSARNRFAAGPLPLTPHDDAGGTNYYPMFKVVVRDASGTVQASTTVAAPVSDEVSCATCHASGSPTSARPMAGWVQDPDPEHDYRLNILRKHDDRPPDPAAYAAALATAGYDQAGLYATAAGGRPVQCLACHSDNAFGAKGVDGVPPLTQSMHSFHANRAASDSDPLLSEMTTRQACYTCHPGPKTQALRGAMSATAECQSCHGTMAQLGGASRRGWLDLPNCQACHTGTATHNSGQISFTSALDDSGALRVPADTTFATNPDTPSASLSLFRESTGHGNLGCPACHGPAHAEVPSTQRNDNLQAITIQGYSGVLVECTSCHPAAPATTNGGPHGLHPIGVNWVSQHQSIARRDPTPCQVCHGSDYRGTPLSLARTNRSLAVGRSTVIFAKGEAIGCYSCHGGPRG